jgi:hypothetical protein
MSDQRTPEKMHETKTSSRPTPPLAKLDGAHVPSLQ